jgi:iron(III) transport system substrate-binding protein
LLLDFILSKEGQIILNDNGWGAVRSDVGLPHDLAQIDPLRTQAIRLGPSLLSDLDNLVRAKFLRRWRPERKTSTMTPFAHS